MCKKVIYLASMVNVLNLEVCKMYSMRKARKVGLFRDFVLAVFLVFVGYMLTATPTTYAGDGYALVFDGVDDYVDAENIQQYQKLSQLTVEFWTWRTASEIWAEQFILGNSYHISYVQPITVNKAGFRFLKRLEPVGNIQFRVYEAEHSAGNLLNVNTCPVEEWAHIAGVFDAGRKVMKMYINGVEEASDNVAGAAHSGVGDRFRIGQSTGIRTCVPGTIVDEVRIWNYVRTPKEIQEYMNLQLSGSEEGLLGYWKLDEGEGVIVYDSSPNQNHGTIEGATWTTEAAPVVAFGFNAYRPDPPDGAEDVLRDVVLSWTPGNFAAPVNGHKVYFSENFSDVNDGIGGIAQDANSYTPGRLDFDKTYYWRVDEVNGPPDYTIFEGDLWQFTTELFAYPIKNITATASSSEAAKGPENTVNGSGLDDSGLLHGKDAENTMWLSSTEPLGAWIEYQFDKVYKLHQMWVWNSNGSLEPAVGLGFKDASVEYSVNGTDY
ncbi:MAG: LamG domain-containing protein, partial [Phycisphaerae bacterium]